jgi:hypothetical protein
LFSFSCVSSPLKYFEGLQDSRKLGLWILAELL